MGLVVTMLGVGGLALMARNVDRAPFRLSVHTEYLWIVVGNDEAGATARAGRDDRLAIESDEWIANESTALDKWGKSLATDVAVQSADERKGRSYRATFDLRPGEQVNLEVGLMDTAPPQRSLTVGFPSRPIGVTIEAASAEGQPDFRYNLTRPSGEIRQETSDRVDLSVGGKGSSWVRLVEPTMPRMRSSRLKIGGIGFTQNEGIPRSGVQSGDLYFLDTPATKMKIFRGTDLRLEGNDMTIESLHLSDSGLEITLSGMASAAVIQLGSSDKDSTIGIMPTYFDRMQRRPWLVAAVATLTLVSGLLGTLFAAGAIFDGVARRIGAKPP